MNIKKGDLVMVVKPTPCCGDVTILGSVFTAGGPRKKLSFCAYCGHGYEMASVEHPEGGRVLIHRLKKIDPPADGDSLPTRADIEVTA